MFIRIAKKYFYAMIIIIIVLKNITQLLRKKIYFIYCPLQPQLCRGTTNFKHSSLAYRPSLYMSVNSILFFEFFYPFFSFKKIPPLATHFCFVRKKNKEDKTCSRKKKPWQKNLNTRKNYDIVITHRYHIK